MSRRTRAVAVAVNAWRLTFGNTLRSRPSCRYSGRKSCPHWLMQWASSTATNCTSQRDKRPRNPSLPSPASRSGETYKKAVSTLAEARRHCGLLVGGERAVVERRRDAVADERVDLILHQRDKGRHDHAQTRTHQRRRLEAQRLATAGREDDHRVPTGEDRVHRFALKRAKRRVTPIAFQHMNQVVGRRVRGDQRWKHPRAPLSQTRSVLSV